MEEHFIFIANTTMPTPQIQPQIPTTQELNAPGAMNTVGGGMMSATSPTTSWDQMVNSGKYGSVSSSPIVTSNVSRQSYAENVQTLADKEASLAVKTGTPNTTDPLAPAKGEEPVQYGYDKVTGEKIELPRGANIKSYGSLSATPVTPTDKTSTTKDPSLTGIEAKYKQMGDTYTATLQQQATDLKAEFDKWKTNDDAIANSLIEGIKATFEASIATMTELNRQKTARDTTTGYTGGSARYAPGINDNVIIDTIQQGVERINTLKAQEITAIAKAKQAKNDSDLAAFEKYMTQVKDNTQKQTDELLKLSDQANKEKDQLLQEQKAVQDAEKAQAALDASNAKLYAPTVYEELNALPDDASKKKYLEELAKKLGIDPTILESSATAYGLTASKTEAATALSNAKLAKTTNPTTTTPKAKTVVDGKLSTTADHINYVKNLFQNGGELGGTQYNGTGADSYVDPDLYYTIYQNWVDPSAGGTLQGFIKQFPPSKYLNPANATRADFKLFFPKGSKTGGA